MNPLPRAIHVINLDRAAERLAGVVRSYDAHLRSAPVALNRFVAMDGEQAAKRAIPGKLSWAEKACFLSHAQCLRSAADGNRPAWIAEDDVVFGRHSWRRVEEALVEIGDKPWDILHTDIYATEAHGMIDLFRIRRELLAQGRTKVLDLGSMAFAGATSYLVNASSAGKILSLMQEYRELDMAVDIWIKYMAGTGKLICLGVFPFATSVADAPTQIQPEASSAHLGLWTAFRWLMWDETDLDVLDRRLSELEASFVDAGSARLGRILAGMMSERYSNGL